MREFRVAALILTTVIALIIVVTIFPTVASAWSLNLANIDLAHAATLPQDSPQRVYILSDAENRLTQAQNPAEADRVALARARVFLGRGDASSALTAMERLEPSGRLDPVALFIWGQAAQQTQQPVTAYDHWRAGGAYEYFSQQMLRADDDHLWQSAAENARIAVGIEPNSADAHYILGDALSHQAGGDEEALQEIGKAQALTNDREFLSTIISRRAEIVASQGRLGEALDTFDQARQVAPIDARPRTGYALTLVKINPAANDQAASLLTQVTQDSPWYSAAYIGLAGISEDAHDLITAEQWYQKGLDRNPNNPEILFALGQFYARQNRLDEAQTAMTLALRFETRADNLQAIADKLAKLGAH